MEAEEGAEAGGSGGDQMAGGGIAADDDRDERWQCVLVSCVTSVAPRHYLMCHDQSSG
jgi:hypothetical protein